METTYRAIVDGKEEVLIHPELAGIVLQMNKNISEQHTLCDRLYKLITTEAVKETIHEVAQCHNCEASISVPTSVFAREGIGDLKTIQRIKCCEKPDIWWRGKDGIHNSASLA